MRKLRKFLGLAVLMLVATVVVACGGETVKVTFDSQGGTAVEAKTVGVGKKLVKPADPEREDYLFNGWFTEPTGGEEFDFADAVNAAMTLYAQWIDLSDKYFVRFYDHRQENVVAVKFADSQGKVEVPANPVRSGYVFGGWFTTSKGLTWNEKFPVNFSTYKAVKGGTTVYAYWEPVNSEAQVWTKGETFFGSLSSTTTLTFNPLTYNYDTEISLIESMSTAMYASDVDWARAIEEGIADFPGDFSKIIAGTYHIDSLRTTTVLGGAAQYPTTDTGQNGVDENGKWHSDQAGSIRAYKWTVSIRNDLKFTDPAKTGITAHDYVYTLSQYVDFKQNNLRGGSLYADVDYTKGYNILNLREYATGQITDFNEVGVKAISDYVLEFTFIDEAVNSKGETVPLTAPSQNSLMNIMNYIKLLHKPTYEASLDATKSKSDYGTPQRPYVSYGAYIMKSWSENQKIVFNKNYDYVLKGTINFKSIVYQFTDSPDQNYELFRKGDLSSFALSGDYVAEYAGNPNNKPAYSGFPFGLELNVSDSVSREYDKDGNLISEEVLREATPIIRDVNFRKAFLHGFDRIDFNAATFAPNYPSLLIWPLEGKQWTTDPYWYSFTQDHLEVLELMGLDPETQGFDPVKAFDHFMRAWEKNGKVKVTIDFIIPQGVTYGNYANYIEKHFEAIFNAGTTAGNERIDIVQRALSSGEWTAAVDARKFDLTLDISGWGFADATFVYMPLKGIYYNWYFGDDAGMNNIYDFVNASDVNLEDAYPYKPIDLRGALEYLEGTMGEWDEKTSKGWTYNLYLLLTEGKTPETRGFYEESLEMLFYILLTDAYVWAGSEPFYATAVEDLTRITAAFEYAILDYVTLIPVSTRASVTTYADNVVFEWPDYSYELLWGPQRYRYLSTDPDFKYINGNHKR